MQLSPQVKDPVAHTHHKIESEGSKCIFCHMPMTSSFARMNQTDHSMLPPVLSATMAYQSSNACNICHKDMDAGTLLKEISMKKPNP